MRVLLHAPIFLVTLVVAVALTPYDHYSGVRGLINEISERLAQKGGSGRAAVYQRDPLKPVDLSYFYGLWGGPDHPVLELGNGFIIDSEKGTPYRYSVVQRSNYLTGAGSVLLEVHDLKPGANLRRYVYLGINQDGLDYFGYESTEAYNMGQATAGASMKRISSFSRNY